MCVKNEGDLSLYLIKKKFELYGECLKRLIN